MASGMLTEQQSRLVSEEQATLNRLLALLGGFEAAPDDLNTIRQAVEDLGELFMLVIIGEFNSGKSSFINALLGERVMEEGVTPTTSKINLLRWGATQSEHQGSDGVIERTYPAEFLRDITIVDTPGTNAIIRQHEALTERFVPRSDLVLFITSADRPFTESERALLEKIQGWGKKIVLILNKIDLLQDKAELQRIVEFIEDNARVLLGITPQIFPLSARMAQRGRLSGNPLARRVNGADAPTTRLTERASLDYGQAFAASGFPNLEKYVFGTLDEASRLRLKLLSPLGVAEKISARYSTLANDRLSLLKGDFQTLENIERQLTLYQEDMERNFSHRLSQIDTIIYETRDRADAFFDRNIRIGRIFDLMRAERFRADFEREVVADLADRVDRATQEMIGWMVDQDLRIWQSVTEYLSRRRQMKSDEAMIGRVGQGFDNDRRSLLLGATQQARDAVSSYDKQREGEDIAYAMRSAVAQTGLAVGVGIIGGALAAATSIAVVDVTGITGAVLGGLLAGVILPTRKRQVKHDFHKKMEQLRYSVTSAMTDQFRSELQRSLDRIHEAISPYSRFVRAEHDKMTQFVVEMAKVSNELARLRNEVG